MVRAPCEIVLARQWNVMSRCHSFPLDFSAVSEDEATTTTTTTTSKNKKRVLWKKKLPWDCELGGRQVQEEVAETEMFWKKLGDCDVHCLVEQELGGRGEGRQEEEEGAVGASLMRISKLGPSETLLEKFEELSGGGGGGGGVLSCRSKSVGEARRYFQKSRPLKLMDEADGAVIAEELFLALAEAKKEKKDKEGGGGDGINKRAVNRVMKGSEGMSEVAASHGWFAHMLEAALVNRLRPGADTDAGLHELTSNHGKAIGGTLASALATTVNGEAAVDEWICRFDALQQFSCEQKWFRPFMNAVAKYLLERVPWGLKARVAVIAALSVIDVTSNIWMVSRYLSDSNGHGGGGGGGKTFERVDALFFAHATMLLIAIRAGLQFLVAIAQNRRKPKALLFDFGAIAIGIKPILGALKVFSGAEKEDHQGERSERNE